MQKSIYILCKITKKSYVRSSSKNNAKKQVLAMKFNLMLELHTLAAFGIFINIQIIFASFDLS